MPESSCRQERARAWSYAEIEYSASNRDRVGKLLVPGEEIILDWSYQLEARAFRESLTYRSSFGAGAPAPGGAPGFRNGPAQGHVGSGAGTSSPPSSPLGYILGGFLIQGFGALLVAGALSEDSDLGVVVAA